MIEKYALGVCQPSPGAALKEVARQIGDRDNAVRKAALNALVQAHYNTGDKLYKLIGKVSEGLAVGAGCWGGFGRMECGDVGCV